jgi:hypothetical protein
VFNVQDFLRQNRFTTTQNRFRSGDYPPSGHPVKGTPLRCVSLRDGSATLRRP